MSIVERALRRIQKSRLETGDATVTPPPQRSSRSSFGENMPNAEYAPVRIPQVVLPTTREQLRAAGVIAAEEHEKMLADQFRRIKWPVLESALGQGSAAAGKAENIVMITSSTSGEGKTFTSFNLAMSIARERDLSVLLVDADVAKGHATRVFGAENHSGLTDVVADATLDPEAVILGTSIPHLTFLPAGKRSDSAPELFASQRMTAVVRALGAADRRRIVLLDSSPLLATNESQVLARIIDQIVFVVRAESTTQPMVLEALTLLDRTKDIRCILNQARSSELSEYYYDYGGYGYGHKNEQ